MVEDISSLITNVKITTQPTGEHYMVLITKGDAHASMLHTVISGNITVRVIKFESEPLRYLNINLFDINDVIRISIDKFEWQSEWDIWINTDLITEIAVAYPNAKMDDNLKWLQYGQSHRL